MFNMLMCSVTWFATSESKWVVIVSRATLFDLKMEMQRYLQLLLSKVAYLPTTLFQDQISWID